MKKQYLLLDGEEQNAKHPETFEIPTVEERLNVKPDTYVKLCFRTTNSKKGRPSGERMWVKVLSTTPTGGEYEGALANQPFFTKGIKLGSRIHFSAKHILTIQLEEGQ